MKILALDCSGLVASVALLSDDVMVAEHTLCYKRTHSETLLPMLDALRSECDLDLSSVDAIAVSGGPGSFTGLRIGSSTAKGLALALDVPIVSVPTVDALAYNLFGTAGLICPLMDARRMQTYTGLYRFESDGTFTVLREACAVPIEEIIEDINSRGEQVCFLGDGVPVFRDRIAELAAVSYTFTPAHLARQRAGAVASLGALYYTAGRTQSHGEHHPEYLRMSQAERERLAKEG